ncbi:FAD-dependent oxidoreductase [Thiomicrorhabdus sp.]|uniref:FAD-dependent oxidoreductase n=1 Tax=Thiomicrorhabdus sp. TaxID=2039724 RepID=UPI0029C8ABCF|nr:FAD-dependent oxidoreductase [Thiomicrorhabdus sp.]
MAHAMTGSRSGGGRIAVLGAGLLGRLLAFRLRNDFSVELFDADCSDATQSAAYLAAAMLAPLAESAETSAGIMHLGERSLQMWPEILQTLSSEVFFQNQGSLLLAFEQDLPSLRQLERNLKGDAFQRVGTSRIQSLEPGVNERFRHGLFLPNEGQLDNRQLLRALASEIEQSTSITWHQNSRVTFVDGDDWCGLRKLSGFDWVIDCRGIGSQETESDLRGVRGEVVRLHAPKVTLNRPVRLMHPRYPLYIAPKPGHQFVVGATQIESEDRRLPTVRSTLELLSACFSVHSGFAEAEVLQIQSGLRPAYPDNEPQMRVKGRRISLNGLHRHGYLLSPVLVDLCYCWLLEETVDPGYLQAVPDLLSVIENEEGAEYARAN